ncbi:Protein of unknown function (DUF3142) [Beggiatoa alba B18LD]|uniref:DUF3142 domain-containing protein n=1 Tax=Beggiatoa alba B18LD TaxID=395493 RepID=I3CE67_9GAMM|nr:DUF3142 domain-containing protein [Beggiatoa alba]EIJ41910.1 Protein of unknown function (DUF3142) [Beggiatoa alba B18LD]
MPVLRLFWLSLSLLIAGSTHQVYFVQVQDYQAFWVWGGIKPAQIPLTAQRLYILQGSIQADRQKNVRFQRQGILVRPLPAPIFLVYRFEVLAWNPVIRQSLFNQIAYWESYQQTVLGIQIDFDAHTQRLDQYDVFLRQVRAELPEKYQLSITGLLDWTQNASPTVLQALADTLDEVIFQTYQGKRTIPRYQAYLRAFAQLQVPFKVGIVAGGVWDKQREQWLQGLTYYRGMVVFLLPEG